MSGKALVVGLDDIEVCEILNGEGAEAEKGNLTSGVVVTGAAGLVAKGFCAVSNMLVRFSGLGEDKEKGPGAWVTPVPTFGGAKGAEAIGLGAAGVVVALVAGANGDGPRAKGLGAAGAGVKVDKLEAKGLEEAGADTAGVVDVGAVRGWPNPPLNGEGKWLLVCDAAAAGGSLAFGGNPPNGDGANAGGLSLGTVTLGAGISFSSSLTKRESSSVVGGPVGAGKASDRCGSTELSTMPMLAASLMLSPRITATRLLPARFDSTYVSENE